MKYRKTRGWLLIEKNRGLPNSSFPIIELHVRNRSLQIDRSGLNGDRLARWESLTFVW